MLYPEEQWVTIPNFHSYEVSDQGRIRNVDRDKIKRANSNQNGTLQVMLHRGNISYRRSVAHLVAASFLPPPQRRDFNTVIHLNGDYSDCRAENLAWRPRFFAIRYHRQFRDDRRRGFTDPVEDLTTGRVYSSSWEAAIEHGLIDHQIFIATMNGVSVFPTGQRFRVLH